MKRIISTAYLALVILGLSAQVEFKKAVTVKSFGTPKILAKAPNKILINQFSVFFKTTGWVAKGSGGLDGVGMAAYLRLEESLAQEIANEGYLYAKQQFEANGYEVIIYDPEKVKASKTFIKESGKGKATMGDGGVTTDIPKRASKKDATMIAYAKGLNSVHFSNANLMIPIKFMQEYFGKEEVFKFGLNIGLGFIKTNSSSSSTMNQVTVKPDLNMGNYSGVSVMEYRNLKMKYAAMHFGSHKLKYTGLEWIADKNQKDELYGASVYYTLDNEAYKKACLGRLNVYIDQLIVAFKSECASKKK